MYCDASSVCLGCALIQQGHAIAYALRKLKVYEWNYPSHDLELVAVVFMLKIWRHYLYVVHCEIFMDHHNLQHLITQRELNSRQHRWIELLKVYNIYTMVIWARRT